MLKDALEDLGGNAAITVGVWVLSVGLLNFSVGSPLTDLYVGFSIVGLAFWVGWKASRYFDEPPTAGSIELRGPEGVYRGSVAEDGVIHFTGPDGARWTGHSHGGRWSVTDPSGADWWGQVAKAGRVSIDDGESRTLSGTLTPAE